MIHSSQSKFIFSLVLLQLSFLSFHDIYAMHGAKNEITNNVTTLSEGAPEEQDLCKLFDNGLICACGPCFKASNYTCKKISGCITGDAEIPLAGVCQCCATACSLNILAITGLVCTGDYPIGGVQNNGFTPGCPSYLEAITPCATCAASAACIAYLARRLERLEKRKDQTLRKAVAMGASTNTVSKAE